MKELSIEQKAKAYDEAIKKAKGVIEQNPLMEYLKKGIEYIFPELKESEDEKIREVLINMFKGYDIQKVGDFTDKEIIAWLEKQGSQILANSAKTCKDEQKPADKVKPKFHEGDWVIVSTSDGEKVVQIDSIEYFKSGEPRYITSEGRWFGNGTKARLWTLQDAKDGDVLYFNDETIVIFKDLYNATTFHSYCHIEDGLFDVSKDEMPDWWEGKGFRPATKEQSDLLFTKMKEAGYEWDTEKKELKKIEQKPQSTWKPSDEQIVALECAVNDVQRFSSRSMTLQAENEPYWRNLVSLLKQLKKLKG